MIEALRADLPNFPVEVLTEWLLPYANLEGWPPKVDARGDLIGRWRYLLSGRQLAFYQALKWTLETRRIFPADLTAQEIPKIVGMVRGALGEQNLYSASIPDLAERVMRILAYVSETSNLPKPPILIQMSDGLQIVDGNHRMTVYFLLMGDCGKAPDGTHLVPIRAEQSFWVAR